MAYDLQPYTTSDTADFVAGTLTYRLRVLSAQAGADVSLERERAGVRRALTTSEASAGAVAGGILVTLHDAALWADGDTLYATRTSAAEDPSTHPASGAVSALAVRASFQRAFDLMREMLAESRDPQAGAVTTPEMTAAIAAALAAQDPLFTAALKTRLEGTLTRAEIEGLIDTALDGLPAAVTRNVTGTFVVALLDGVLGSRDWRLTPEATVSVDPAQMSGSGAAASPITIIARGITVGLLAANAVETLNLQDQAVTLDKLSGRLQGNWQNMLRAAQEITTEGGVATITRVDGTTYTVPVGQGSGGGGGTALAAMTTRLPAAPQKTLAGVADAWSSWTELVHSAGLSAEQAGVVTLFGAVVGNVTSDATTGGQRVWCQSRIMRKRGSVETDLGHSIPYVRNLGSSVTQGTEDTSQLIEAPVSMVDEEGMEGDEYHLDVRLWCQGVAMNAAFKASTDAAPAGTRLQMVTGGGAGGGGGGALEVFSEGGQREPVSRGTATQLFFRDANVTLANGRASVDPVFPPQQPADWDATSGPTRILNKPGSFVETHTTRPTELDPDRLYAYAGAPDQYGGPGLYQASVNHDTPLNLVAGKLLDTPDMRSRNFVQALPTSPSNHWLLSWGMRLDRASRQISLWVRDDAPAAATLYAQLRTQDAAGTWSSWSAAYPLSSSAPAPSARFTAPADSRHYGGQLATPAIPANWSGGWGRDTQIRVWTDRLATTPYALKLAHVVDWIEDPEIAKAYLETRTGAERLSTHSLKDGAVARVFTADPVDLSGYVEGELVVILSEPPVLKVVTATRDQPVSNANRFTVATDEQGNGVSAQGDFDPNPGNNYLQIHASPGDGTATNQGRVTLYLDTPGDTPPASFIARPVTGGFPALDFTRITGPLRSVVVGAREFQGYEARFTSSDLHLFSDATFSYDLFTAWTSSSVNTPLNVNTGTVHVPAMLRELSGGSTGGGTVPSGGWAVSQLSAAARSAANVSVDTSTFTGDTALSSGDDNVQQALETLAGSGGRPIRILAADSPADGGIPIWLASGTKWIGGKLEGAANAIGVTFNATREALGLSLTGKLLEIFNAFDGGGWSAVAAGAAGSRPYVSSAPRTGPGAGVPSGITFNGPSVQDVSPAWPQTEGGQTWIIVRTPIALDYQRERYRVEQVDSEGTVNESVQLDHASVRVLGRAAPYDYYAVPLTRIGADEDYRMAVLTPFEPVRSRLDLVTAMLRDFVAAATRTQANDRRVVVWDWATRSFLLGNPERPTPIARLPDPMETGRRYITTERSRLQPTISVTPAAAGANIVATATFKVGTEDWQLIRFGPGAGAPYANQTVLRAPAGSTVAGALASGGTPPFLAIVINGTEASLGNVGTDARSMILAAAPAYNAGTTYELVLRKSVDPHENVPPAEDVDAGDWTATGTHDVVGTPGAAFDWATRGNPDPIPAGKIPHLAGQEVLRHAFRMPLTTTLSNNRFSAPALLDASIDLDDAALAGAELIVTLDVEIEGTGANDTLSWESDAAAPTPQDRRYHFSTRVGVAALERQADYVARTGGAPDGFLEVLELSAFRAGTTQGRLFVGVVHEEDRNAAGTGAGDLDRPGVFVYWTGAAGAVGAVVSGTVTAHLSRITGGSASSFTGLPDTPASYTGEAGKIPKVNQAANALEFALDSDTFLRMRDTPDAYTGEQNKGVVVGANALEFRQMPLNPSGKAGGKSSLVAKATIPTGVHAAGTLINTPWAVQPAYQSDYSASGGTLFGPRCVMYPGWVIEVFVGTAIASCSWVNSSALDPSSLGRGDTHINFPQPYKLGCSVPGPTAAQRIYRAVNLEFQRQLSDQTRDGDAFRLYGAGNAAIQANTEIRLYEWSPGEGTAVTESSQADFDAQTSYDDDTLYVVTS